MSILGDRVKKERIRLGMTQEELAKKAGYSSRTSINKIENGRPASLKVVHKLAKALNVSEWYLLGSDDGAMIIFVCLLTLGLLGLGKATGSILDIVISGFVYLFVIYLFFKYFLPFCIIVFILVILYVLFW